MKIIIDGAGEVGSHLAKMLRAEANEVTVIDNDEERLSHLAATTDIETLNGSPSSIKILKEAGVGKTDLFIAVYPFATQEVNIVCALLAKQLGAKKVLARVNDQGFLTAENRLMFKEMGIDLMFFPEKIAADEIAEQLKHSASAEIMEFAHGRLQIAVFKLDENSPMLDYSLGSFIETIPEEEKQQLRIIALSRDEKTIIPNPDTKFQFGDMVYTIAKREGMPALIRYFGKSTSEVSSVMILGGSQIAEMVAESLSKSIDNIKIIDSCKERCLELTESLPDNILIVNGDGRNSDFLYEESIRDYDAFLALTGSDETNVLACVVAKKFGVPRTIAEVENIEYMRLAEDMGVDTVINKKLITAGRIFKFTLTGKARFVKYMTGTDAEVIEYTVAPDSAITKGAIKDIAFPKGAIIGGVIRGSDSFIAVGDTRIQAYDRVAVFTLPENIKDIDRFFK